MACADNDAFHLASAFFWQDILGEPLMLATYDRQLWEAAKSTGLISWPVMSERRINGVQSP